MLGHYNEDKRELFQENVLKEDYKVKSLIESNMQQVNLNNHSLKSNEKIFKSLNYWNKKFAFIVNENMIVFSLIKNNRFHKILNTVLIAILARARYLKFITMICRLVNTNYIAIEFSSQVYADKFKKDFEKMDYADVKYISNENQKNSYRITVEGLPPALIAEKIPLLLQNVGEVANLSCKKIVVTEGHTIDTETVIFDLVMKDAQDISAIPLFIYINTIKLYLKVRGRPKVCYKCDTIGHVASQCKLIFCTKCRTVSEPHDTCSVSYANKMKFASLNIESILMELENQQESEEYSAERNANDMIIDEATENGFPTDLMSQDINIAMPISISDQSLIKVPTKNKVMHSLDHVPQENLQAVRAGCVMKVVSDISLDRDEDNNIATTSNSGNKHKRKKRKKPKQAGDSIDTANPGFDIGTKYTLRSGIKIKRQENPNMELQVISTENSEYVSTSEGSITY